MGKKAISATILAGLLVLFIISAARAENSFQARQAAQRSAIYQGMKSGRITEAEFADLDSEQYGLETFRREAVSDGYLSGKERRRLDRKLDRAEKNIRRARFNDVLRRHGRWSWHPRYDRYGYYDYWRRHYQRGPYWPHHGWRHRPKNRPEHRHPPRIRPYGRLDIEYHRPGFGLGWSIHLK